MPKVGSTSDGHLTETTGTEDEHALTKNILLKYARHAEKASLFNHASMAHNNHLFFSTLSPTPPEPSSALLTQINTSFSSMSSLRATFVATANAMFGPGFVWLVRKNNVAAMSNAPSLAILTTYLAGSPYPGAHYRQQPVDMATQTTNITGSMSPQVYASSPIAHNYGFGNMFAGKFGPASGPDKTGPGGQDLDVLLGVNTWEHVWLRDWGVGGKKGFLDAWWERIDWGVVEGNMGSIDHQRPGGRKTFGNYR